MSVPNFSHGCVGRLCCMSDSIDWAGECFLHCLQMSAVSKYDSPNCNTVMQCNNKTSKAYVA